MPTNTKPRKTFDMITGRLLDLNKVYQLREKEIKLLSTPVSIQEHTLQVNGCSYPSWRIIHNNALGPGKGGIRFHPNVCLDEVKSLAFWMALKNSLSGLPYGGAKGGIKFNPKDKTKSEIESISRAFIQKNYQHLGQDKDIPAPDVYTNEQTMAWMLDEYEKQIGKHEPGMITGKPIALGGIKLRGDATARGGFIVINELLNKLNLNKRITTVAIQGFGNAGLNIAKMFFDAGFNISAVSDSRSGTHNAKGLNISKLEEFKNSSGSVYNYQSGENITNEELLELDVDILVLAALENQITEVNAGNIKARIILELANGPVTFEADKILYENQITVVPDILANSGGVVVSYFEWAQNKNGGLFEDEYLSKKLDSIMKNSFNNVYSKSIETQSTDLRTSAYIIAIDRILKAERLRGNV